jgi:hypothetical protein
VAFGFQKQLQCVPIIFIVIDNEDAWITGVHLFYTFTATQAAK